MASCISASRTKGSCRSIQSESVTSDMAAVPAGRSTGPSFGAAPVLCVLGGAASGGAASGGSATGLRRPRRLATGGD
eukprot:11993824-Alexandrium_andersonii.AAC.1